MGLKQKSDYIIHNFKRTKDKQGNDTIVHLTRRMGEESSSWRGIVAEDDVKEILSNKQFQQWKRKERNEFVRHYTVTERKEILKLNNKKHGK